MYNPGNREGSMEDLLEAIIWLVESGGPGTVATNAVTFMARATRSSSAAAFALSEAGELRLFASHQIDQRALDAVQEAWAREGDGLRAGGPITSDAGIIAPLKLGSDFVGVLFLAHASGLDLGRLSRVLEILAKAMKNGASAPRGGEWAAFLERTSPEEVAREQLVVLLEQNEWNVARVARLKGVTRPTIYNWMERYRITRKKPLLQSV
jgi:transcriptional regulator with GAF, ATPase, and Fis domain